jgi:RimJ/RimL family protein N-acetyltransferase
MEINSPDFRITTKRLILRPLVLADADDLYEYQSVAEVVTYIPWPQRTHDQVVEALAKASASSKLDFEGDYALLGIVLPGDDKVIGQISLMYKSKENQTAEFGYVINPKYSGQGYATEATEAAIDYLFSTGKFRRIYAHLDVRNSASEKLVKRLGLRKEAEFKEEEFFKGEWTDTMIYATLKNEWSNR